MKKIRCFKSQINWLKYQPKDQDDDLDYYECFHIKRISEEGIEVDESLTSTWVGSWVSVIFYKLLMKLPNIWIHVPPGNPSDEVAPEWLLVADVPIKYKQGKDPLCFAKSMASVLYYVDLKEKAGNLKDVAFEFSSLPLDNACKHLKKYMSVHVPIIGQCLVYNFNKWRSKSGNHKKRH